MLYHKYRLRNVTRGIDEFVWAKDGDPAPMSSPANPSDYFDTSLTARVDSAENPPDAVYALDEYKAMRRAAIDARTQAIIAAGFPFDGHQFSLSASAQMNWSALETFQALISWPVAVTTMDDQEYSLAIENKTVFCATGVAAVYAAYASGRALKLQVNAAADQAGVDAVVDTR